MKNALIIIFIFFITCHAKAQTNSENLFYMTDTPESFKSFIKNIRQISIVCPQTFLISSSGVLSGSVDRRILDSARKYKIKVMPLIVNGGFNSQLLHTILINPNARKRSIRMMLDYAKKYKLDGWQFDLEGLNINDRDSFTIYFKETATALHQAGLSLSAALVHNIENVGGPSPYHNSLYENWRAGYSFKSWLQLVIFYPSWLMTSIHHVLLQDLWPGLIG
ncbi:MAG: hypothetical protein ABUT20_08915 [Bacteroidota bacterium]